MKISMISSCGNGNNGNNYEVITNGTGSNTKTFSIDCKTNDIFILSLPQLMNDVVSFINAEIIYKNTFQYYGGLYIVKATANNISFSNSGSGADLWMQYVLLRRK